MNGTALLTTLAWRNLWRHRRRTLIMLFAIALGVWLMIATAAFSRGIIDQQLHDTIYNLTGHSQVHQPGYRDDPAIEHSMAPPDDGLRDALNDPRVHQWSTRVRLAGVVMSERESTGVTLVGIDADRERGLSFIGDAVVEGRTLESPDDQGVILGRRLAERLGTGVGRRVVIMSQDADGQVADRGFRVVGLFRASLAATENAYVFVGRHTAQTMLKMGDEVSELALMSGRPDDLAPLAARLKANAAGLEVMTWGELEPILVASLKIYDAFMVVWYLIIFLAMSFGLVNTMLMAVFERTREIGLYQALGMAPRFIVGQVLVESLILLLIGLVAGNLLSWFTVLALAGGIDLSPFAQGLEAFAMSSLIYPVIQAKDLVTANSLVIVLGLIASLYPAWRAARYTPVQAITRT